MIVLCDLLFSPLISEEQFGLLAASRHLRPACEKLSIQQERYLSILGTAREIGCHRRTRHHTVAVTAACLAPDLTQRAFVIEPEHSLHPGVSATTCSIE